MSINKKQIRKQFRDSVFKRDGYKCKTCGNINDLDAHHIVDRNEIPNGGYILENGITLCSICHLKAEKFHMTDKKEYEFGFHPNDLFNLIK